MISCAKRIDSVSGEDPAHPSCHQRLKVLKDLGRKRVQVVFVDLPEAKEKALNLTLNKSVGEWDEPKLARLLQEFEGRPSSTWV